LIVANGAEVILPSPASLVFSLTEMDENKNGHSWKVTGITTTRWQENNLTKSILEGITANGHKLRDLGSNLVISMAPVRLYRKLTAL